jgi:transcriptional regulator with GAF, ATPase, and Fis domain
MEENILIVEDEFIVANDLRMILEKAGHHICGIAPSYARALELVTAKQPKWVLLDIFLKGDKTGIDLGAELLKMKIPFIYISANTNQTVLEAAKATQPYGFLVKPFREKDLLVMLDIANYNYQQSLKLSQQRDNIFQKQVEAIIASKQSRSEKLEQAAQLLAAVIPFNYLSIIKANTRNSSGETVLISTETSGYQLLNEDELLDTTCVSRRDVKTWRSTDPQPAGEAILTGYEFRKMRMDSEWLKAISTRFQLAAGLYFTVDTHTGTYLLSFYNTDPEQYAKPHLEALNLQQTVLSAIIQDIVLNYSLPEKVAAVPDKQPVVKAVREERADFHGIIGKSPLLRSLFDKIELVAPDDISVLILGESGTGKERIAHTIHHLSPRKNKPMITVNCAALPINLIESELFGHEKGAFTGANDKRIGKFEQADGGSIFLDEIGELPLEAQVKLLRVLQEKEIERLGGSYIKKVNVRIITATNRNLEKEVAEGRFRLDLYYRLNVFPIELPPLRNRKEDISLLAYHFLDKYSRRSKRNISSISTAVLEDLSAYHWPGNIRELEHLIEKSIILTPGEEIVHIEMPAVPASGSTTPSAETLPTQVKTMEEMERDHIMSILRMCKGKIFGPGGAAEILNIPSTTLNSKIKKLGIKYEFVK